MSNHQDNSSNKREQNDLILSTFQNIEYYDFQDGSLYNGLLIISKDMASFNFRWSPYKLNRKLFSFESENQIHIINSLNLFRVVIETNHQYCEVSLYSTGHDEPTIFRASENHINFSHQLAQIFTINSVFLNNPNWIYLAQLFLDPPTEETGPVIYYLSCYNGKFSFPVFLTENSIQKVKDTIEKAYKTKETENDNQKKLMTQQSQQVGNTNNDQNIFKNFFNFSIFSNTSSNASKPPITANQDEKNDQKLFLSNFSQIFSKYKIKPNSSSLPLSISDFMLLCSQKVPLTEIRKMVSIQGMNVDLRKELWPVFLSIVPFEKNEKVLNARVSEYKALKIQWSSLSEYQLAQSHELRSAFYTIGMDVKRTTVPSELFHQISTNDQIITQKVTSVFKKFLENILKTFAVWNYNIRYTQGINEIVVPFACVALYDIINEIVTPNHQNLNFDNFDEVINSNNSMLIQKVEERESIAFWCFVSFQEKSQNVLLETSMTNLIELDIPEILEIVKKQSRDAFKFVKQYQLDSLNFLVSPFMLLFRRSFSEMKVERLWDTIIALDEINSKNNFVSDLVRRKNFEYAFAASVVIFIVPLLKKKIAQMNENKSNIHSNEAITEVLLLEIPEVIESLPIEYVIRVALSIENDLPTKTQPRISVGQKNIFENEFFSPALLPETNIYSSLGLFC